MTPAFDMDYWESHWQQTDEHGTGPEVVPNPYLAREVSGLAPGTALDAGCGEGGEAIWLATEGWQVTAADISPEALSRASVRATKSCAAPERVQWVEADLRVWEPGRQFDLVTTHYAHAAMPQLALYERLSGWVAPGGTLLIVGHRNTSETPEPGDIHEPQGHGHHPLEAASVTAASITVGLETTRWAIVTADEPIRIRTDCAGRTVRLADVVVRARRRA